MRYRNAIIGFLAAAAVAFTGCSGGGGGGGSSPTPATFAVSTASIAPMTQGVPYNQQLDTIGGSTTFVWSIVDPAALPPGITLQPSTASTATLSGTPTQLGTFTFTVLVRSGGRSANRTFTVEVSEGLAIVTTSLVPAREGDAYADQIEATGGRAPYTWSITQGQLPPGLTLLPTSSDTVEIDGTPTSHGSFTFEVQVEDADARVAQTSLTIDVENIFHLFLFGDLDDVGFTELFRATCDGRTLTDLVRINEPIIPTNGAVRQFQISPDKNWLAYVADGEIPGQNDLYLVDVSTTPPGRARRISEITTPNNAGDVNSFRWSPDSKKIAYNADAEVDNFHEMYIVDLSDPNNITTEKASPGTNAGFANQDSSDESFDWSPDSRYLAFQSQDASGQDQLVIVDVQAGTPYTAIQVTSAAIARNLTAPSVPRLNGWILTAADPTILFLWDEEVNNRNDLFYVTITNGTPGTPTLLVQRGSTNSTRGAEAVYPSPDGKFLAIRGGGTGGDLLWISDVSSGTPSPPVQVTAAGIVSSYAWVPDSKRLIVNCNLGSGIKMYVIDVTAQSPTAELVFDGFVTFPVGWEFDFSPDGDKLWFRSGLPSIGYMADISPTAISTPVQFTPNTVLQNAFAGLAAGAPVGNNGNPVVFSPDGNYAAYTLRDDHEDEILCFLNDTSGPGPGTPEQISPDLAYPPDTNDGATRLAWTIDSRFLFMRGNWDVRRPLRVYSYEPNPPTGPSVLRDLTPSLPPNAVGITDFKIRD